MSTVRDELGGKTVTARDRKVLLASKLIAILEAESINPDWFFPRLVKVVVEMDQAARNIAK